LPLRDCRRSEQKAAAAPHQFEYGKLDGTSGSAAYRPVTADKILKICKSYGPFKSVDDLRAIKGIAPQRLEKMRKYLTVIQPSPKKPSQQPARTPPTKSNSLTSSDSSPEQQPR
jgi:hypothetical protein